MSVARTVIPASGSLTFVDNRAFLIFRDPSQVTHNHPEMSNNVLNVMRLIQIQQCLDYDDLQIKVIGTLMLFLASYEE